MSQQEQHKGKLKQVEIEKDAKVILAFFESHEELDFEDAKDELNNGDFRFGSVIYKNNDRDKPKYFLNSDLSLYEFIEYENLTDKGSDHILVGDSKEFTFYFDFYNGGTYLDEMIEESINELKQ